MEKKNKENKVLYASLVCVLAVLSALIIITGLISRREGKKPDVDTESKPSQTEALVKPDAKDTTPAPANPKNDDAADVKPSRDITETVSDESKESGENAAASDSEEADPVNAEPTPPEFIAPVNGTVSKSHSESTLVFSMTMNDYRTHSGVDITSAAGAEVKAAASGVIGEVWEDPLWGSCVSLNHEGDCVTVYRNLTHESIKPLDSGDKVNAGDIIGCVGETALLETADEPHLHFEIRIGGVNVDPCDYIEFPEADITDAE